MTTSLHNIICYHHILVNIMKTSVYNVIFYHNKSTSSDNLSQHLYITLCKELIIPDHILLSDKKKRGKMWPKHPRVTFSWGFSSDSNIWLGMINPDYDISVYNNLFNYLLCNILILPPKCLAIPHLGQSRWEDKVTATKIRGSSTLTKTLLRSATWVD